MNGSDVKDPSNDNTGRLPLIQFPCIFKSYVLWTNSYKNKIQFST